MKFTSAPTAFQLNATQILNVREAKGTRVVCNKGILWLTQEGDSRDIFLRQGDEWVIGQDGLVLIQALERAAIQVLSGNARSVALDQLARRLGEFGVSI